jgi:hypothetical protein
MNAGQWIMGLFRGNASDTALTSVRASGENDGRLAATAYVDGFLEGAADVFHVRMQGFQILETVAIETKPPEITDEDEPETKPAPKTRKSRS